MAKKLYTGADFQGQKATGLADGTLANDAATFGQLEALRRGAVWHPEVKAATTAAITLSATQTVDGIALAVGDRVLVKDQGTASQNGIYVVASGSWTRATDLDETAEFTSGVAVTVEQGTVNADKAFIMSTDGAITVGTSAINFVLMGGTGTSYSAGVGISLAGGAIAVVPKANGGLIADGTGLYLDPSQFAGLGLVRKFAQDVPSASSAAITHGLNTTDIAKVSVYVKATGEEIDCDKFVTSASVVTLGFASAPAANTLRVVISA